MSHPRAKRRILVLVGQRGAGKSTAASILKHRLGAEVIRAGQVMQSLLAEAGMADTRPRTGAAILYMRRFGFDAVARRISSELMVHEMTVVDGFRTPEEIALLRSLGHQVTVLSVEAAFDTRVRRAHVRNRDLDELSESGFLTDEILHLAMAATLRFAELADIVVFNNGTLAELEASLQEALSDLKFAK